MSEQKTLDGEEIEVVRRAGLTIPVETLEKLYYDEEMPISGIADRYSVSYSTARRFLLDADIELRGPEEANELEMDRRREEREYIDPDILERSHHDEKLSLSEIGEKFGVTGSAISYWMDKFDIETRSSTYDIPQFSLCRRDEGMGKYPLLYGCDGNEIPVHQLVVIAHGADPHDVFANPEMNVDHKNRHPADNRPQNLELMDWSKHGQKETEMNADLLSDGYSESDIEFVINAMLNPQQYLGL